LQLLPVVLNPLYCHRQSSRSMDLSHDHIYSCAYEYRMCI
jgi:hypothetical protein